MVNPRIVCVALTGYGSAPGQALLPGYDALVQAESGWASLTGGPDDPPTKSGLSLADYICGLTAMVGLLAGLRDADRTGVGRDVDTNLYDSALAMLSYPATWFLSSGFETRRLPLSAHPSVVPFQFFATADGHIAIACPKERFFSDLVRVMGLDDLATDERYASFAARGRHRDEVLDRLGARFAELPTGEWLGLLRGVVPIAPVRSMAEALDVHELTGRGMLAEYDDDTFGRVRSVGLPLHVAGFEPAYRPGPSLGGDTDAILGEHGFSPSDVARLRSAGAFGRTPVSPGEPSAP
jgi:crotonobetainyl-CoA:carnitine CoA-transferase CaiB-like acyl-CoA transferase